MLSKIKINWEFLLLALLSSLVLTGVGLLLNLPDLLLIVLYSAGVFVALRLLGFKMHVPKYRDEFKFNWLIFVPVLYVFGVFFVAKLLIEPFVPGFFAGSGAFSFWTLLIALPFVFVSAFMEELGWREFLFKGEGNWMAKNIGIGVTWSLWHWPAVIFGAYPVTPPIYFGLLFFTVNLVLLSLIFGKLRVRFGLLAAVVAHSIHNLAFGQLNESFVVDESGLLFMLGLILTIFGLKAWKK
ncbi:CPBP family intramembrane metalloprotease [Candidatus Gracilibacteria bacterium]|nr:CPBP family intramembrane metalloprotease [Candidatus Gracilibacteria bacterium]